MVEVSQLSTFPASSHDHADCVSGAIEQAEALCQARGLRLTSRRRRVLELVWSSHQPVGAYDILQQLGTDGATPAPPTVYRALEFLIEAGLVHRIDSLNAYVGCADPTHTHAGQFLICTECRSVAELDDPEIESLIQGKASAAAFDAKSMILEIQGTCHRCSKGR